MTVLCLRWLDDGRAQPVCVRVFVCIWQIVSAEWFVAEIEMMIIVRSLGDFIERSILGAAFSDADSLTQKYNSQLD